MNGVWLVLDFNWHVDNFKYPFPRCHRTLEYVVVHCERPNRVEESLYEQYEGDHDSDFDGSAEYKETTHDHDDCHCRPGEGIDDWEHHDTELGGFVGSP